MFGTNWFRAALLTTRTHEQIRVWCDRGDSERRAPTPQQKLQALEKLADSAVRRIFTERQAIPVALVFMDAIMADDDKLASLGANGLAALRDTFYQSPVFSTAVDLCAHVVYEKVEEGRIQIRSQWAHERLLQHPFAL